MTMQLIWFVVTLLLLLVSGSLVVTSLTRLASALRLAAFTVGVIIMAFATTSPELLIGMSSALQGSPEISLGNVIGTSVANLGLIFGLTLLVAGQAHLRSHILRRDLLVAVVIALLPIALAADGLLSRLDGVALLGAFVFWLAHLLHERREFHALWNRGPAVQGCLDAAGRFVLAVLVLVVAAQWTVSTGLTLAASLNIPVFLLGLLALGVGTSLPELIFVLKAVPAGKTSMAIGDLVGATAITSSLVIGLTAVLAPIQADLVVLLPAALSLVLVILLLIIPLWFVHGRFDRRHGLVLILIWVVFALSQLSLGW